MENPWSLVGHTHAHTHTHTRSGRECCQEVAQRTQRKKISPKNQDGEQPSTSLESVNCVLFCAEPAKISARTTRRKKLKVILEGGYDPLCAWASV